VPVLVIHGDADDIVPFSQGQEVFAAANERKRFWRVPGANHNTLLTDAGSEYAVQLASYYDSLYPDVRSDTHK
jgi:fermentation-respiration switch protein FrsA (DUF1100 family)